MLERVLCSSHRIGYHTVGPRVVYEGALILLPEETVPIPVSLVCQLLVMPTPHPTKSLDQAHAASLTGEAAGPRARECPLKRGRDTRRLRVV